MKILFVNHTEKKCGVYQYGLRVYEILKLDKRFDLHYLETNNQFDFFTKLNEIDFNFIVYNWHDLTMKWLTPEISNYLSNKKQLFFFHESGYPSNFTNDGLIMCNMHENENNKQFSILRPIFETNFEKINNKILKIGSFGFGFENKGFERICKLVNDNFDLALIHLHITTSFFCDQFGTISNKVIDNCRKIITKKNIELKITTNFMTNYEILEFLNSNSVNIFLYDDMIGRGLSSTIDYATSVNVPLVVNNSTMFRHLLEDKPQISIDNNSITNIINMGTEPVEHFRKKWSNENMRDKFYKIIEKLK